MTKGLASKWATDDDLITNSGEQDSHEKTSRPVKHSKSFAKSFDKSSPAKASADQPFTKSPIKSSRLESKWADADDVDENEIHKHDIAKGPRTSKDQTDFRNPDHRKNHGRSNHHKPNQFTQGSTRGKHSPRYADNEPNGPGDHNTYSNDNSDDNVNDDEQLPPMTDAAKSLASRLGVGSVKSLNPQRSGKPQPQRLRGSQKQSSNEAQVSDDQWEDQQASDDSDDSDDSDSHNETKPMSEAGMSLASRLGMVSLDKPQSPQSPYEKRSNDASKPKGRYLTPKQKKQAQAEAQSQAQVEAQLKEKQLAMEADKQRVQSEIDRIMQEMQDPNSSWADIE